MGKAADWLKEERRKTLGDWAAFCPGCGHVQRFFEEFAAELAATCPTCGETLTSACPACGARFKSGFATGCEECGAALRPGELFGVSIRKPGR